jgi:hypothetical protein
MIQMPDHTLDGTGTLGETTLNADPQFPFVISHANGYFVTPTAPTLDGRGIEVFFRLPYDLRHDYGGDIQNTVIIGAIPSMNMLIVPGGAYWFKDGYDQPAFKVLDSSAFLRQNVRYKMEIRVETNTFYCNVYEVNGGQGVCSSSIYGDVLEGTSPLFTTVPTIHFGYPTIAQLGATPVGSANVPFFAGADTIIDDIALANDGFTNMSLSTQIVPADIKPGAFITNIEVVHSLGFTDGFLFEFSNINNEISKFFEIRRGGKLHAGKLAFTPGVRNLGLYVQDIYGWTEERYFPMTTGAQVAPTDIALSISSIEATVPAEGGVNDIAVLSATDADPGDVFTFSLVAGTGDTNNANFRIDPLTVTTASLCIEQPLNVVGQQSLRVRVTDGAGNTYDKALTFNVVDTTAPVQVSGQSWTPNIPDGTSYDITFDNTSFPNIFSDTVGVTHFLVTYGSNQPPAAEDVNWIASPGPTTFTIPIANQEGSKIYGPLLVWAKDGAGNVSEAGAESSTFILTI